MIPRINKKISNIDKLSIYVKTAFKLFRGGDQRRRNKEKISHFYR